MSRGHGRSSPHRRHRGICLVLGAPAPALAAYDPQFSLKVEPATPNTASAITGVVTQAAGETAGRTVRVILPPGFGPNSESRLAVCGAAEEAASVCPAASRMGTATAVVPALGIYPTLTGPVFYGGLAGTQFRLLAFLDGAVPQKLEALAGLRPDGSVETVFDNLPNLLVTSFTLALDGGERSLLRTPSQCGTSDASAVFLSHAGEQITRTSPLTIAGCSASGSGPASGAPAAARWPGRPRRPPRRRCASAPRDSAAPAG